MNIGVSQIDITPPVGIDLCGFAKRIQPSVGILDPLAARGLYLEQNSERLLWIHADLLGFERELVLEFRQWARQRWNLEERQVLVSATHTHSGPATIHLQEAGKYDARYMATLYSRLQNAAEAAMSRTEPCNVVMIEGRCTLAIDRRKKATPHTDPRVGGIGFQRSNGEYIAVITNYAMHAVAMGPSNRMISADIPGRTAAKLTAALPGKPIALITNGACGNLNPPYENITFEQLDAWGGEVADAVIDLFKSARPIPEPRLRTVSQVVPLPLDALSIQEIEAYAAHIVHDEKSLAEWGDRFRNAVNTWKQDMIAAVRSGKARDTRDAELFAICLGDLTLLGMNAEVFSRVTDDVRQTTGRNLYVVGYANGDMGYIPTKAAYDEGGYEVEIAHLFYCNYRPKAGGLELLTERAVQMVKALA